MAIQVKKRPYSYSFSGNPVHYQLYSALAAADDSVFFEVRLQFATGTQSFAPTEALPYYPYAGIADVDVSDLLEGLLQHELPAFLPNEKAVQEAIRCTGSFYLEYREITSHNPNPSWDGSELDASRFVVKGGVSRYKYQGNNFWTNYFDVVNALAPNPFLTWQVNGRLADAEERMYLLYLNLHFHPDGLIAQAKATYTDGSSKTVEQPFPTNIAGRCYYLPAGAAQWGLQDASKTLWRWQVVVLEGAGRQPVSQTFSYESDNRNDYNDMALHYRNSLGGLDSVRIRGVIQQELEYEYTEQGRTTTPDYYSGEYYQPQKSIHNNRELQVYRGDVGYLNKEEQDRLRDIFVKREVWRAMAGKWVPHLIITKSFKLRSSEDSKWSLPIEFSLAHEGDAYYTPEAVHLGTGVFTENVCLAYLSPVQPVVDVSGGQALVTVLPNEIDPQNASDAFRYRVYRTVDGQPAIDWTTAFYTSALQFQLPKEEVYTLEVQAICTNAVYGAKTTAQINTITAQQEPEPEEPEEPGLVVTQVRNNTATGSKCWVWVNGSQKLYKYVGAFNAATFYCADESGATVEVSVAELSPSAATLTSNGVTYMGVITNQTIVFTDVEILNGLIIDIY